MLFVAANAGERSARAVNAPHPSTFETSATFPGQESFARGIAVAPW